MLLILSKHTNTYKQQNHAHKENISKQIKHKAIHKIPVLYKTLSTVVSEAAVKVARLLWTVFFQLVIDCKPHLNSAHTHTHTHTQSITQTHTHTHRVLHTHTHKHTHTHIHTPHTHTNMPMCTHLHQVIVWPIQIFVKLNDQTFEERRELALHFVGIAQLGRGCLHNKHRVNLDVCSKGLCDLKYYSTN